MERLSPKGRAFETSSSVRLPSANGEQPVARAVQRDAQAREPPVRTVEVEARAPGILRRHVSGEVAVAGRVGERSPEVLRALEDGLRSHSGDDDTRDVAADDAVE